MAGKTALDCLRMHCHGDHSVEGQRGDVDGVMRRIATTFQIDQSFAALSTLEERCEAFVKIALAEGLLVDLTSARSKEPG
jgi:hypothetical protein